MNAGWLAVVTVIAIVVAGCSGGGAKPGSTATSAPPPTVGASTGSIAGSIVDDEARPVVGADVGLTGATVPQIRSDATGRFTFNDLAPGAYSVISQALGYESASRKADVVAGEVTEVRLELVALAVSEPRAETEILNGRVGCSYFTPVPVSGFWSYCPEAAQQWDHRPCLKFNATEGVTIRQAELVWVGNGPAAPMNMWLGERNPAGTGWNAYDEGPSPLVVQSDKELKFKMGKAQPEWCVFIAPGAQGLAPNVAIDQAFTIYYTAFYDLEIPADFKARPE